LQYSSAIFYFAPNYGLTRQELRLIIIDMLASRSASGFYSVRKLVNAVCA